MDDPKQRLWEKRIAACVYRRDILVKAGDRVRKYADGGSPDLQEALDAYEEMPYDEKDSGVIGDNRFLATFPLIKRIFDTAPSAISTHEPSVLVKFGAAYKGEMNRMPRVAEELIRVSVSENSLPDSIARAVNEALAYNLSAYEVYYDTHLGLPGGRWISGRQLVWDTSSDGSNKTLGYVGYEHTYDIEYAREKFDRPDLVADATSLQNDVQQVLKSNGVEYGAYMQSGVESLQDRKRVITLYVRGDDPTVLDPENDNADGYYKVCIDPIDYSELYREPWGMTLDYDKFPIKILRFDEGLDSWEGKSPLGHLIPLQRAIDSLMTCLISQARRGSQTIGDYDATVPSEYIRAVLAGAGDLFWPRDPSASEQLFRQMNMPGISPDLLKALEVAQNAFSEVSLSDDLSAGALAGVQKSGVARAIEGRSGNRLNSFSRKVEGFAYEVLRAWLQIAIQKMRDTDVADWVDDELLYDIAPPEAMEDPLTGEMVDGEPTLVPHWPKKGEVTDKMIRREMILKIEEGSLSGRQKQEKVTNLEGMWQSTAGFLATFAPLLQEQGIRIDAKAFIDKYNTIHTRIAELLGETAPDVYAFNDDDLVDLQAQAMQQPVNEAGEPDGPAAPDVAAMLQGAEAPGGPQE